MWRKESEAFRRQLGLPGDFKPWTGREQFQGIGLSKTERVLEMIDSAAIQMCMQRSVMPLRATPIQVKRAVSGGFVDVSQSLTRNAWAAAGESLPVFTGSTALYSFSADRLITGREMLNMHGYSSHQVSVPCGITDANMKKFAANGMALPCLATVIWALWLTRRFPESEDICVSVSD